MKVEDASKLYEFLSHIEWQSFIAICLLVILSLLLFVLPKERLSSAFWLLTVLFLSVAPLLILYTQSMRNNKLKHLGTFIKQDFAFKHFRQASLRNLNLYTLNSQYDTNNIKEYNKLIAKAWELEEQFPNEFLIVIMNKFAPDSIDKIGLCVIDSGVLRKNEQVINENAERTSEITKQFMETNRIDKMYIDVDSALAHNSHYCIRQFNDKLWHIGPDFYTAMVGRKGLIPIYVIYKDRNGNFSGFGNIIGFTIIKKNRIE